MAIDPSKVKRFAHGSRVPGWDEAADLTKDPAVVPDPATTPVPEETRREIEAAMALYPDVRSAAIPALKVVQREHGWCSPTAIEQAACVMRLTPAYLTAVATFYDMFDTVPVGRCQVYVCTNISCSLRGADELYDAMLSAAGDDPRFNVRPFECLGACDIAPMASIVRQSSGSSGPTYSPSIEAIGAMSQAPRHSNDGEYVGPLEPEDCRTIVDDVIEGRPVLEAKQLKRRRKAVDHWKDSYERPDAERPSQDAGPDAPRR